MPTRQPHVDRPEPHARHALRRGSWVAAAAMAAMLVGACDRTPSAPPAAGGAAPAAASPPVHEHRAPHRGCLVELGEEFAHLEVVLDPATGGLTAYALDGEAERPVRLKQERIAMRVTAVARGSAAGRRTAPIAVSLEAVANPLSGETVGDTSEFAARSDALKGATAFAATLTEVTIRGEVFKDVRFQFPGGNDEHAAGH